ncbi:unnamed protein product [Protopolystoma xenopodis]|uniref:Uncharacterized protein n=1 Tax=Protopolystoma xenopodis TaxID=117903 RepID=A0A3S4ZVG5_9PLAT|nr:unnamed protein product [Protopolystoma xenopodis]
MNGIGYSHRARLEHKSTFRANQPSSETPRTCSMWASPWPILSTQYPPEGSPKKALLPHQLTTDSNHGTAIHGRANARLENIQLAEAGG